MGRWNVEISELTNEEIEAELDLQQHYINNLIQTIEEEGFEDDVNRDNQLRYLEYMLNFKRDLLLELVGRM